MEALKIFRSTVMTLCLLPSFCRIGLCDPARLPSSGPLTITAERAFIGSSPSGVCPIVVSVTNDGPPTNLSVNVTSSAYSGVAHEYRAEIQAPGGGAVVRYTALCIADLNQTGGIYNVHVQSRYGGFETTVTGDTRNGDICLISNLPRGLRPVLSTNGRRLERSTGPVYTACYVTPAFAPERAIGYSGLGALVVGNDARALQPTQWHAIRQWVIGGGELIVLGQPDGWRAAPEAQELLPVTFDGAMAAERRDAREIESSFVTSSSDATVDMYPGRLIDGAASFGQNLASGCLLARRQLGAGRVVYCAADLTARPFREMPQTVLIWAALRNRPAIQNSPYNTDAPSFSHDWNSVSSEGRRDPHNPFTITLPTVNAVLTVFLVYFVLAVPVSFVVLKRLRRMNWAWATGPALAILFAGVLYFYTSSLYRAPLSRRTTGFITVAAGDKDAQFNGNTEMFFPRFGRYDITAARADSIELNDAGRGNDNRSTNSRALETFDGGTGQRCPDLDVGNLAFRRAYYTQTLPWGGLTADLQYDDATETIVRGSVTNGTGNTLRNAYIRLPQSDRSEQGPRLVRFPVLRPGVTRFDRAAVTTLHWHRGRSGTDLPVPIGPTLTATMSGETFGAQVGKYVGGEDSVTVITSLPALRPAGN